jgi:DNA-binding NarL/FixJ family response regulator
VQLDLSEEEKRILEMIVGNMSVSEIAFALDVEKSVIDKTRENIFGKLRVHDSSSASEIAAKLKLVNTEL